VGSGTVGRPVSVAVVDDQDVVVEGVRAWIAADSAGRVTIVAVGQSVETVLGGPGREADVIVLDLELDGGWRLDQVTKVVAKLCDEGFRVVVFSVHVEPLVVQSVLKAGACAFLDKGTDRNRFVDTIVAVAHDQPVVTQSMAGGLLQAVRLSGREREALLHLFQGMDHDSIARRIKKPSGEHISAATVKQYIERARAKFAAAGRPCRSNFTLLARCIEQGLIRPEEVEDYRAGQTH
jgi:two-component system, NarL family, nitrate/nitrite response regulator NarL